MLPSIEKTDNQNFNTLAFDESVLGWPTFYTYNPEFMFSVNGNFYSIPNQYVSDPSYTRADGNVYQHYIEGSGRNRNIYYGNYSDSSITFVLNPNPSTQKVFKTISYEGNNGWQVDSITSDVTGLDLINAVWQTTNDQSAQILSYNEGAYTEDNIQYHAGFTRKENKYVANLINNSPVAEGEVIFGVDISGIKGYVATVKMSTDSSTNVGGVKELFASSSEFVVSSI